MAPMNISSSYTLSHIQQGILFENLNNPSSPLYSVQMIFDFTQTLNLPAFIQAFTTLVKRHEILRSAITYDGYRYLQSIFAKAEMPYFFHDCSALTALNKKKDFEIFLKEDLLNPLDLANPPLMRLACFKFSETKYKIIWTRHHILLDGASVEKLIKELFIIYQNAIENKKSFLIAPPAYAESLTLHDHIESENEKKYWRALLKKYTDVAFLPAQLKENTALNERAHKTIYYEGEDYQKWMAFSKNTFFYDQYPTTSSMGSCPLSLQQ